MHHKVILYHGGSCMDGFCSAFVAWLRHRNDAKYIAVQYGEKAPIEELEDKDVYILDFSYDYKTLMEIAKVAKYVILIDHHKTAEEDVRKFEDMAENCKVVFDTSKSGAMLTWDYFNWRITPPSLIEYIQDRDLWKWEFPESKLVSQGLRTIPMNFSDWLGLLNEEHCITHLIENGKILEVYEEAVIEKAVAKAYSAYTCGYVVPHVNSTVLISEIGNALCKGHPFAVVYQVLEDKTVYSLRSDEAGIDVATLAKEMGGGGHKHAAAFSVLK